MDCCFPAASGLSAAGRVMAAVPPREARIGATSLEQVGERGPICQESLQIGSCEHQKPADAGKTFVGVGECEQSRSKSPSIQVARPAPAKPGDHAPREYVCHCSSAQLMKRPCPPLFGYRLWLFVAHQNQMLFVHMRERAMRAQRALCL